MLKALIYSIENAPTYVGVQLMLAFNLCWRSTHVGALSAKLINISR
jgi:hypothetical protein